MESAARELLAQDLNSKYGQHKHTLIIYLYSVFIYIYNIRRSFVLIGLIGKGALLARLDMVSAN